MNVNKKLGRLKQWGKERMGSEVRTDTNDEFKSLEVEMQLRQEGLERLQRSATTYVKSISKRDQGVDKERQLPIGYMGSVMLSHGDDFEADSEFGQCLTGLGRTNERIARMQETYAANATDSWLESLERSLVQMKEYQVAKKKLETRRLAYDTALAKIEKSKKEDFRVEEELRSQKAKYEESNEDVWRRMQDIKEAEVDSIGDLTSFLEAELTYYDRCREVLLQLRKEWPATNSQRNESGTSSPGAADGRYGSRSRSNTAGSLSDRFNRTVGGAEGNVPSLPMRPTSRQSSAQSRSRQDSPDYDFPRGLSSSRTNTGFESPVSLSRDDSPNSMPRLSRVPTDPTQVLNARSNLRVARQRPAEAFDDGNVQTSGYLRKTESSEWSTTARKGSATERRGPPPPPPPSRAKKPPPPPPMKRSALSSSSVSHY